MKRPRIYNSEYLLDEFFKHSNPSQLKSYIRSLYAYLEYLQEHTDIEEESTIESTPALDD